MPSLAPPPDPHLLPPDALAVTHYELDKVLQSRAFEKTPTLKKLLIYLWEHRSDSISEYAIAIDALGRRQDFDPRVDASVRVLLSRLRQRLKDFYENEGAALSTRLVIPVGRHQVEVVGTWPQIVTLPSVPASPPVAPGLTIKPQGHSPPRIVWVLAAVIALLLISNAWTLLHKNQRQEEAEALPKFWQQFLGNERLTRIVLPNPVFFGWDNGLLARDVSVNDFSRLGDSTFLTELQRRFGPPSLAQHYVASSDAFASNQLIPYLDPRGGHVLVSTIGEVSASNVAHDNLILLGTPNTLAPLQSVLDQLSFRLDANKRVVTDSRPSPGMPSTFGTVQQSSTRITTPGIIACLPGGSSKTHILVLMTTYYTSALVSYITSESGLKELRSAQIAHGNSPYFEAVIDSEVEGSTALKQKLLAFRSYQPRP